ncbi:hypothetical protein CDD83_10946 [Cordyceps sp. RAO-2017]|nr:hypothetical protein CDD83_10946 [Cordyceps sp. RAO-2017]
MEQRETPMAILRNLSRALAPASRPVAPSSSSPADGPSRVPGGDDDDDDDELPIDKPRLSLPLDHDDDDDDDDLQPPRSAGLEEENFTVQSIELPRRALSEQPGLGLLRGSFGNERVSDFFEQYSNYPADDTARHSEFFPGLLEDIQARAAAADFTLDRIDIDPARRATMGRDSDFGLQLPAGLDDQTTFLLSEPVADLGADSPVMDHSLADAAAPEGHDEPLARDMEAADSSAEGDEGVNLTANQDAHNDASAKSARPRKRQKRLSKHGIEYPSLPPSFVKKVAQTALHSSGLSNPRISADTLAALTRASDWFFEQLGDDLGAFAKHAKRKTVEESDVVTLMRRQRQVGPDATIFSLAQRHLPRELLQELRMPVPQASKKRRGKRPQGDGDEMELT